MAFTAFKTKLSNFCKVDPSIPGCLQRRFQRPTIAYFTLSVFLFLVALNVLSPYMPKRSFPDTPRPNSCDNCFPYTFKNLIEPRELCRPKEEVELVMLITTVPQEKEERMAIRATWCNTTALGVSTVRCVFLFGGGYTRQTQLALEVEARRYNDILQEDFFDSYYNLSIKVIMGYRWLMRRCTQVRNVIRTAGDNYVHVPQVLELLRTKGSQLENYMFGYCRSNVIVWRWPFHRWVVSFKEYPNALYPPYCVGTTFVTSYKLMTKIVEISVNVPFFPIEDVYFGMVLQQYKNEYRLAYVSGFSTPLVSWSELLSFGKAPRCSFPRPWYSIHDVTPADIWRVWKECQNTKSEKVLRLSKDDDEDLRLNNIYSVEF